MDSPDTPIRENSDYTPAVPLEISNDVAERADNLLRGFAEDAGLETALVVDRSGALVSGISSEPEVTIDVISALVAGASGAMRALVAQLGETGRIESVHQGGERLLYLREMVHHFILVGVSGSSLAPGIVREKANQIQGELEELLNDIKPSASIPEPVAQPVRKSLREVARQRRAERMLQAEGEKDEESVVAIPVPALPPPIPQMEVEESPEPEVVVEEEDFELPPLKNEEDKISEPVAVPGPLPPILPDLPDSEPDEIVEEVESVEEPLPALPPEEPKEVLVPLDFDEPEIVIEGEDEDVPISELPSEESLESSPFELESDESVEILFDDEGEESGGDEVSIFAENESMRADESSIFEIEEDEMEVSSPPALDAGLFELDDAAETDDNVAEEGDELVFELDDEETEIEEGGLEHLFELEEEETVVEEPEIDIDFGEADLSEEKSLEEPSAEEGDSGEEEAEVKGSGPMYF